MEMTIDKTIEFFNGLECHTPQAKDARDTAIDTMRKYQQLQADYENRLKADMTAMITELQLEFEEDLECGACCDNCQESCEDIPARWFLDFIQQKINNLKED